MSIDDDFAEITDYAHFWNWCPDWGVVEEVYKAFPNSYSVLTPFAYTYLEELIRSMTSEYGLLLLDASGKQRRRKVGIGLVNLAIEENRTSNQELVTLLEKIKPYFRESQIVDGGDNRNSVVHGYKHPKFWDQESFETLIHDIALLSKHAGF